MALLFEKTQELIRDNDDFLITTHVFPDGDGIGSELALARFLAELGKKARILNASPTPRNYRFLDHDRQIMLWDPAGTPAQTEPAEVIFIVDICRWERLGPMNEVVRRHPATKICIDHHPVNGDFADINLICEDACASGELLLRLITAMGADLTPRIAEPLYASILADTGVFRFANTTAGAHAAAARLLATGINSAAIYEQIYERCSPARLKLMGLAMSRIEYLHDGRLAWSTITSDMLQEAGVAAEELEGFVDYGRAIDRVQASLLFIELDEQRVKVSLRSKGKVDVNRFASKFGGGGHQHAAGILLRQSMAGAVQTVLQESSSLFNGFCEC